MMMRSVLHERCIGQADDAEVFPTGTRRCLASGEGVCGGEDSLTAG